MSPQFKDRGDYLLYIAVADHISFDCLVALITQKRPVLSSFIMTFQRLWGNEGCWNEFVKVKFTKNVYQS